MSTYTKQAGMPSRMWPVAIALAIGVSACGPMTFADDSALVVLGDPPPPPPPPPEPEKPKRVEVTADAIVIHEKIQFDYNKSTIKPVSHSLLNEVVSTIKEHPQIKGLSVEGHTDADGSDEYNQKLSDARAAAVRKFLTTNGVPDAMLTSKGWGEARPIADNESDEGKAKNRRVEFIITAQDREKKIVEVDPATGEKREVTSTATQGGPR